MLNIYLFVIDVFIKYAWVRPLKYKTVKTFKTVLNKGIAALNAFIEIVNKSNRKPNKLWVDQRREFYNRFMQEWVGNNNILMHSKHNEGKSRVTERFIKTLKPKDMTANDSKSYLPYPNKLVGQYKNTYDYSINKNLLMLIVLF